MTAKRTAVPVYAVSIGSSSDNELVFDRPTVSTRHAHIFWDGERGQWLLEDLGSTNGTFLRGIALFPGRPEPVRAGETIHLGKSFSFVLEWSHLQRATPRVTTLDALPSPDREPRDTDPVALGVRDGGSADEAAAGSTEPGFAPPPSSEMGRQTLSWGGSEDPAQGASSLAEILPSETSAGETEAGQAAEAPVAETVGAPPVGASSIAIGYADDNAVQVKNPVVSGHHARLYRVDEGYVLEDQGSTNGTWFQGARVRRVNVSARDAFWVGNHRLMVADLERYFASPEAAQAPTTAEQVPPGAREITLGRSPECVLRLDAPMVSAFHARLTALGAGRYRLEDLGSTNGTFVNSRENQVESATVGPSDVIFLGSYRLPVSRLGTMLIRRVGEEGLVLPAGKEVIVVGRDDSCDIVLRNPQVSRRHAEIRPRPDGGFDIRDLNSINGTYVNGQRIKSQTISPQDVVAFASVRIRLDAAKGVVRRDYHGDMMLQAERVTVSLRDRKAPGGYRTIVHDASFTAYPTEFVGLMGPSGAGKTTLMLALNGYLLPTAGRSLINGYDLYTNYNSFRGNIGYVPQDDIIYRELTVFESLYYTAKLRLPPDTSEGEIERKIEDVLETLEIQQTRDVRIGDAVKKGISGGQRKRVNLAQELLTEPSLLFLDEPTSGLASEDTINVMNLLRRLADEGRTIVLTIHQPSLEAYRKLDNVIYLFQGQLVYYGSAYPDGIAFFHPEVEPGTPEGDLLLSDPGNALKALAEDKRTAMEAERPWQALDEAVRERRETFLNSRHYKDYVYDRAVAPRDQVRLAEGNKQKTERRGWLRQWWILTRRYATIVRKDLANTAILLLQAPIIGLVLSLVFAEQAGSPFEMLRRGPSALFLLVASAVWFGCSNSAREIVRELPIYRRERMVNLMIPSYVLSKFTVLGVVCALQCLILLGIVYTTLGYEGAFLPLYGVLLLSSLAGVGMGLTLSAFVGSSEAAMALVPLLLIPQIVFGGIIMPVHELNPSMQMFSAAMVSRWGFEAVLHIEYGDDHLDAVRERCGIDVCPDPHSLAEAQSGQGERLHGPFGDLEARTYFPSGEGVGEDVCTILCENARRGTEVTPLERGFGLDVQGSPMRRRYRELYGVGRPGAQTGLLACTLVLAFFNILLFGLVCAILRYKDVEVG